LENASPRWKTILWILYKICLDIAPRPFKDLEWHKGKKTRHHHRLSLLRKGLLATKPVVIFSRVRQTPFETRRQVSLRALAPLFTSLCKLPLRAAIHLARNGWYLVDRHLHLTLGRSRWSARQQQIDASKTAHATAL
jgi:hypothetical protein